LYLQLQAVKRPGFTTTCSYGPLLTRLTRYQ